MKHIFLLLAFLSASLLTVKAQDEDSAEAKLPQTYQKDSVEQYVFAQLPDTVESTLDETRLIFSAVDKYLPEGWREAARADIAEELISELEAEDPKPILDLYLSLSHTDSLQARVRKTYQAMYDANHQIYPGNVAPDFSFTDTKGATHRQSELRGKLLLVDIWGTWCVPCIEEIPYLKQLHEKYGKRADVSIMSIACDKQAARWKTFLGKHNMPWHQYLITPAGDKVLDNVYHVVGIPRFIVVGRDGKIISADSLRPSDKEFGKWFEGLVNNK